MAEPGWDEGAAEVTVVIVAPVVVPVPVAVAVPTGAVFSVAVSLSDFVLISLFGPRFSLFFLASVERRFSTAPCISPIAHRPVVVC
jgi:hypothetical protein